MKSPFMDMNFNETWGGSASQCIAFAPKISDFFIPLTSIAGQVHVNDFDLTAQILVSPWHTCSVSWQIPNRSNMERSKSGS